MYYKTADLNIMFYYKVCIAINTKMCYHCCICSIDSPGVMLSFGKPSGLVKLQTSDPAHSRFSCVDIITITTCKSGEEKYNEKISMS